MTLRLLFLGPPGAGKGTQARILSEATGAIHIATGDMFREAARQDTPLGRMVKDIMARGDYVPDDITIDLVKERLGRPDASRGFILDGFPRTAPQAKALSTLLESLAAPLKAALLIEVPQAELIVRLAGRRSCSKCGAVYHLRDRPPASEGRCDQCGGALTARADDSEETIQRRLEVYEERTRPLVDYYQDQSLLRKVSGMGPVGEIAQRVAQAAGVRDDAR